MPILLNNCRDRPHSTYYLSTDGHIAFYDLDTEGHQAKQAVGLAPGTMCVVVSKPEGRPLQFQTYRFEREEVREAPPGESGRLRVFFGSPVGEPVEMTQEQAAKSGAYAGFFNVLGHFKRAPVIS